jgi:uncharacterized alpha-E superfamily protein
VLSRIAESLFWIGRYIERADDTARLLDVHVQLLLEDPWVEEDLACRSLLSVMDHTHGDSEESVGWRDVLDLLAYDAAAPSAIAGSIRAARENARRAREVVSTELWEAVNVTWNQLPTQLGASSPHAFFSWARERSAVVWGIVDGSISRDDTWQFLVLGRSIERADMTARLLTTRALAGSGGPDWATLLRSCGAYESYLRRYRGIATDESAAGFLLLDRVFPRSVVFALSRAEQCLQALDPVTDAGEVDEARRHLGRVRTGLEYQRLDELVAGLPGHMEAVQRACTTASDAIRGQYFPSGTVVTWTGV